MNRIRFVKPKNLPISDRLMWGLLAVFAIVALLTASLTFIAVRGVVASLSSPTTPKAPASVASEPTPEGLDVPLQPSEGPTPRPWDGASRVNILFMGLDYRDWEEGYGPARTDTMILFTLDPATRTAGMLSIPRDLWVNIPGFDYGKINTANFLGEANKLPGGGPGLAIKTVEDFLGVQINFYAQVDFAAFEKFIDELGGIEVDVPEEITVDPIGPGNTVTLQPGKQRLDGKTALAYARNRDTIGNDFDRAQRQQQVILAIRDCILSLNMLKTLITKSPILYKQLSQGVRTNLSLQQVISLAWTASQIAPENIRRGAIGPDQVTEEISFEGLSILVPKPDEIRLLRDEIFTAGGPPSPSGTSGMPNATGAPAPTTVPTLPGDPKKLMLAENARVSVLNGTYTAGLAARTKEYLSSQGINITVTDNAGEVYEYTTIIDYTGKIYTRQYLAQLLKVQSAQIYSRYDPNSEIDVAVLLGNDWAANNNMP